MARIFLPHSLEDGGEALDPTHNGSMRDRDTALRYQLVWFVV
jgi:hypothetical protein